MSAKICHELAVAQRQLLRRKAIEEADEAKEASHRSLAPVEDSMKEWSSMEEPQEAITKRPNEERLEASKNQAQQNKAANCRTETRLAAEEFVELMPQHLSPEQFHEFRQMQRSEQEWWRLKGQEIRKRWELKEREE